MRRTVTVFVIGILIGFVLSAWSQGPVEPPLTVQFNFRGQFTPEERAVLNDFASQVDTDFRMMAERQRKIADSCCP